MSGYISYFKLQLLSGLQYRAAALAGLATQFFWGFMSIFIYQIFYENVSANITINFTQLVTYIWLNQAFFALTYIAVRDTEIIKSIKSGTVAYELCRPYNLYFWWYVKVVAKKYASFLLRFAPIVVVSLILPSPYNLSMPISFNSFILFFLGLILGSFVLCSLLMLVNIMSFFTYHDSGISSIFFTITALLSGQALPVPLLPIIIQNLTYFLPFRLIGDLSFRIYSGNIGLSEALKSMGLQVIWILILIIIGNMLMKKATKKVFIQGG
jgi:ABC-2 type transport system permease protein